MTLLARLRAAWHALLGTTALAAPAAPAEPRRMQVSAAAEWEARRTGRAVVLPEQTFARARPMPGVMPKPRTDGLAFDYALPSTGNLASYALDSVYHEGLGFLGYPYLAELAQRAEYRRACEIWAEHAVRKWVKWRHPDTARLKAFGDRLVELGVRDAFKEAAEQDGLFGRSQIHMSFTDNVESDNELAIPLLVMPGKIKPARPLRRIKNIEPMWIYPGPYVSNDPLSPSFYKPSQWYVFGRTVSDTRLLTFVGREVPDMLKPAYAFGGLSLTQMMKPYVDNWLRTRQSVSDAVHSSNMWILKTDMSSALMGGNGADLYARVDMANETRDNRGMGVVDKESGEEVEVVSAPLTSLDKLQAQAQEQMSSVTGIPLVILLGVTPSGLNASSDGEVRSFYANVKAYQEKVFRPNLKRLADIVSLSLWGEIDTRLTFEFPDLWETSELDRSTIQQQDAARDASYVGIAVLSNEDVRERLSEDESGPYYGLSMATGDIPEPPSDGQDDDDDAQAHDGWITTEEGSHILLDDDGVVIAGAGGKLNGKKLSGGTPKPKDAELHHIGKQRERLQKLDIARGAFETERDKGGSSFSGSKYQIEANKLGFHPLQKHEISGMLSDLDVAENKAHERIKGGVVYPLGDD